MKNLIEKIILPLGKIILTSAILGLILKLLGLNYGTTVSILSIVFGIVWMYFSFLKADPNNIQVLFFGGQHFDTVDDGKFRFFIEKPFLKIKKFTRGNIVFDFTERVEHMKNGKVDEINTVIVSVELKIIDAYKFSVITGLNRFVTQKEINDFIEMRIFKMVLNDFRSTVDQIGKKMSYVELKDLSDWTEEELKAFSQHKGDTFFEKINKFGLEFVSVVIDIDENPLVIKERVELIKERARHAARLEKVRNEKDAELLSAQYQKDIEEKLATAKAAAMKIVARAEADSKSIKDIKLSKDLKSVTEMLLETSQGKINPSEAADLAAAALNVFGNEFFFKNSGSTNVVTDSMNKLLGTFLKEKNK